MWQHWGWFTTGDTRHTPHATPDTSHLTSLYKISTSHSCTCWLFVLGLGIPVTLQVSHATFRLALPPCRQLRGLIEPTLFETLNPFAIFLRCACNFTRQLLGIIAAGNMWLSIAGTAAPHTSHATRHTPHVTRHTPHVTRRTPHVTRHTPHVTRHTSRLLLLARRRVCGVLRQRPDCAQVIALPVFHPT
jgi:hypothetical protein